MYAIVIAFGPVDLSLLTCSFSDNIGKNTGDKDTVKIVKQQLGYVEKEWANGDETSRWGKADDGITA
jgi:hypothetical protein